MRHAAIVEASSDAIISCTLEGVVLGWNRGAEEIFGIPRAEAIGTPIRDVVQTERPLLRRPVGKEAPHVEEVACRRANGEQVVLSVMPCNLSDSSGSLIALAAICRDVTESRRQDDELRRQNVLLAERGAQLRALASRIDAVREEERTRIARTVHDELGQLLTGVRMDLHWLARRFEHGDAPAHDVVLGRLTQADELVGRTIQTVQQISLELRPSVLDALGLPEALRDEGRRFSTRTGIRVTVRIDGEPRPPGPTATAIFRVFQELLTNVARHAHAKSVSVDLLHDGGRIQLIVEDDGVGLSANARGLGLLGIEERMESLGGEFRLDRGPEAGTIARASVPAPAGNA